MEKYRLLFLGDIQSLQAIEFLEKNFEYLKNTYKPDIIIANAENASTGKGCTEVEANHLFKLGIKVLTGGNHSFDKPKSQKLLETNEYVLRPNNFPVGTIGKGFAIVNLNDNVKIGVISLQGRALMDAIDCPFRNFENLLSNEFKNIKIIFVDFHAETTAEKYAFFKYFDGKVTAIVGTHTHIQTNDEQISEKGTAYISDVGMVGPYDSVIGIKQEAAINRLLYQTPQYFVPAENDFQICGVVVDFNIDGKALQIEKIFYPGLIKIREI
ncbi:MAG TPA: TIGR00282 family metallophosphoesterase [Ignavibacteriales bacterium]|nr:TIGR00282 family metallophosphoesterase [Ignavibacteriales bacterium]HOM65409.1 TIGR00282 family metallophosphoesterase [Ignavibacteriales bacterium]